MLQFYRPGGFCGEMNGAPARIARGQLLAARMTMLHHRLPKIACAETPGITADLLAALRCLFDSSACTDVLEAPSLDPDLLSLAERSIAGALGSPDLSPATIAARLQVSRATLYRIFAPVGGVMHHVWDMRLQAVRAALDQPSEPRTLARLAEDCGCRTASHLTRVFRAQFGATPRDWRQQQAVDSGANCRRSRLT